jgi:hypothetical protein
MPNYIHYVAVSGDWAFFGLSRNPAADVATMQKSSPAPIELVAGWIVPPAENAWLKDKLDRAFRRAQHRGYWIRTTRDKAAGTLAMHAAYLGGKRWKVRKRPHLSETTPWERDRPVLTPRGRYQTAKAAGDAYGISRQAAWERANRQSPGWRFENETRPPPVRARVGRPAKELS